MDWRRFRALVRGLSTSSAFANAVAADHTPAPGKAPEPEIITDPDQAERAVLAIVRS